MANTDLWDKLGKTDPAHTKQFTRGGGFRGTAIKPMWSYRRMTEEFGPCGQGWGINAPSFQVVPTDGEVLVYCTVSIWYGERERVVFGVGGDKVVGKFTSGLKSDDEAFKKAFTDGITNALKMIGVGADVHMGMFDDNKYVNEMKAEFRQNPHVTKPSDILPAPEHDENGEVIDNIPQVEQSQKLTVVQQRPIFAALQAEVHGTINEAELRRWMNHPKTLERVAQLKPDWQDYMRGVCAEHLTALRTQAKGDDVRMAG